MATIKPSIISSPPYTMFYGTTTTRLEDADFNEIYLVKFGGDVYVSNTNPSHQSNAIFGEHIALTSYNGELRISVLADEYFTHAKVICSLGQVIGSIAEAHIDKK